ncbi:MAG TPA: hypothetical protein VLC09_11715 [Polyangiaceae bacterium]|nr:hypothetical protein [Polyangiaceae bacterium]
MTSGLYTRWATVSDAHDDLDVPPMVRCSRCGRTDCAGCEPVESAPSADGLPWERPDLPWLRRLYLTAERTALEPDAVFGRLDAGPWAPALAFALACETLAVLSLGLPLTAVAWWVLPQTMGELFSTRFGWGLFGGLAVFGLAVLWIVHWLWGFAMELGAGLGGGTADHRRGFRFGMYSTGWDLLTSPAGVLLALSFRGVSGFGHPILQATRVARHAVYAYLDQCRQLSPNARRGAMRVTFAAFALALALTLLAAALGTAAWVRSQI